MPTYSEQSQGLVAYKVQSALGSQATGSGAQILRNTGGSGGQITKAAVESQEVTQDAMSTRGRHGSQRAAGAYDTELSLGNVDTIMEALLRGTYGAADVAITEGTGSMSSATLSVGANTIVASAGSWITSGFRVGEVIRLTAGFVAGNQSRNLRITALTATTITVAETLTVEAGPLATYTLTRPGRMLINPAAGSLMKRYFTIEENDINIDGSEIFTDCVWSSMSLSMAPDGMFMANPSWTGTGQYETVSGASAPFFTTPTQTTGLPMSAIDATLRLGSGDVVDLTSFDLTIETGASVPGVVASNYGPDVFLGTNKISMNLGMLRSDLLDVADFINETQMSLSIMIAESGDSAPTDFISIHIPNFTFGSVDKSALSKSGGPRTQTISVPDALIGKDTRGGAYAETMISIQTSNAA